MIAAGRAFLFLMIALAMSVPAEAGEDEYIFVDRMPDIRGEKQRSLVAEDGERRVRVRQDIYTEQFDHAWLQIFVLSGSCLDGVDGVPEMSTSPHIMAIKYLPKKPASFTIATLHDIYKEVYVDADEEGGIRLYEDIGGAAMLELSERYGPRCVGI